jgi:hypothetical protein
MFGLILVYLIAIGFHFAARLQRDKFMTKFSLVLIGWLTICVVLLGAVNYIQLGRVFL